MRVKTLDWLHLKRLEFVDPDLFSKEPFDLLLCELEYAFVVLEDLRKGPYGAPVAQLTSVSWILAGADSEKPSTALLESVSLNHFVVSSPEINADELSLADTLNKY